MKIARRSSVKKPLIISGIIVAAMLLGAGAWWYFSQRQVASTVPAPSSAPTNTVNYGPATEEEKADSEAAKQDALNNQPAESGPITVVINRASKVGNLVSVRTTVTGTQQGSCDMAFTKSGQATITKTFPISQGPTAAVCNGDVPASEFGAGGSWNLSVTAKNNSSTSPAVTQTVDVAP